MLKFSVGTNWDDRLIAEIEALDPQHSVTEIYGKLASDFFGGGRPTYAVNVISKKKAGEHIKLVKKTGREFNYLLNAPCLNNREFTRTGQKQIKKILSWLDSIGVDGITVANPYLGHLIKKNYPRFNLTISVFSGVNSVSWTKFWVEEIGADKINLSHTIIRDFPLLRRIRGATDCELQLAANEACIHNCPFGFYHATFISHASQSHHPLKGFGVDWSLINCRYKLFTQPEELIKAHWVRPEDLGYYENIGIDTFKILDRVQDTQNIIFILKAYLERKFDGNLIDLFFYIDKLPKKKAFFRGLKFFLHPLHINIFKFRKIKQLFSDIKIYADNRKLDGFLEYFFAGKCKYNDSCDGCDYCRSVAERAIHIDDAYKEKIEKTFKEIMESLNNGDMFRYF